MPLSSILPGKGLTSSTSRNATTSRQGDDRGDLSLSQLHLDDRNDSEQQQHQQRSNSSSNSHPHSHSIHAAATHRPLPSTSSSSSASASTLSRPKPPHTASSRDSVISAAYFSAEEDIADGSLVESEHSTTEATPRPLHRFQQQQQQQGAPSVSSHSHSHSSSTTSSQQQPSPPPSPSPTSNKKKRRKSAGKGRQKDPPPPPAVSPRRASLGGSKAQQQQQQQQSFRSSSASTSGGDLSQHSPTFGSAGLAIGSPLVAAGVVGASAQPLPRKSSISNSAGKRAATASAGLGLGMTNAGEMATASSSKDMTLGQEVVEKRLLQRWILSIGVVNFDLEKGPDLEMLSPPLDISREERDNIAFSSFPDTSIFDVGDTSFSFRAREVPLDASVSSPPHFATVPPSRHSPTAKKEGGLAPIVTDRRGRETSESGATLLSAPRSAHPALTPSDDTSSLSSHEQQQRRDTEMLRSASFNDLRSGGASASKGLAGSPGGGGKISNSSSSSYIYGYVFFRQKRDPSIRRGYFQKSLVILSHLPYVALFSDIVNKLGPLYFEHGNSVLEAFSSAVTKWPNPAPGATLPLPLFGSQLWVALPLGRQGQSAASDAAGPPLSSSASSASLRNQASLSTSTSTRLLRGLSGSGSANNASYPAPSPRGEVGASEEDPILASIPTTPLITVFKEALSDLWLIWECVLLAEPILVIGPDPKLCSEAVWHLLDICRPIPHAGDFRPFFTIHDYDFKNLATRKQPPAGTIIGCTNPFLAQACSHWPHVLRVGKPAVKLGTAGKYGKAGDVKPPMGGGVAGGTGAGGGGPQHLPGFETKKKRRVSKDRPMLKKVLDLVDKEDNPAMANVVLRRYLADITERFLAPLNRYVSSLIPATNRPVDRSQIRPFNTDDFLASLKAHGTPLLLRSRSLPTGASLRQGLYLDFLRSPNFSYYLTERIAYFCTLNPVPSSSKTRFERGEERG